MAVKSDVEVHAIQWNVFYCMSGKMSPSLRQKILLELDYNDL